jgi:hypothetical protein
MLVLGMEAAACFLHPPAATRAAQRARHAPLCWRHERAAAGQRWRCCGDVPRDGGAAAPALPALRFGVGDRVMANTGSGHVTGVISQLWHREPDWPADQVAPYQIEIDDGRVVHVPRDSDDLVRPEGAEPWRTALATAYHRMAKHADLFCPLLVDEWFVPELRAALADWQQTGNVSAIDVAAIPGLRLEAPGVISFDCLQPGFCDKLLEEARHYSASSMPQV